MPGDAQEPDRRSTDSTSLSLLERVKAEDEQAWQRLVALYSPMVQNWCRRSGLSVDESRDVSQEVFVRVTAKIGAFRRDRAGDTFRGWLRVITRNKICDYLRKKSRQPAAIGGSTALYKIQQTVDEETLTPNPQAEQEELDGVFRRALQQIKGQFEEQTWTAFRCTALDGRKATEVARELGMTPGAVRHAKYKVFRRLRAELGDFLD